MQNWSLTSWQHYKYLQAAYYADETLLHQVAEQLSLCPPLVTPKEVRQLKNEIARAGRGETFILQGGDCAESFKDCRQEVISNKLKILLQMSLVLVHGLRKPIVRIGRIAGQYAKPRSNDFEERQGIRLPSYRGDLINSPEFCRQAREPNPHLLLQAYHCAAATLNYIRAILDSGFANLKHPRNWELNYTNQSFVYQQIVDSLCDALELLESIEALHVKNLAKVDFYTSHEALHLHYEQALTRQMEDGLWYNLSTHLPWIGMRTGQIDSAHVEFLRGTENPIGIKIGPDATPQWLEDLLSRLNPKKEEGRLLLFTRLGAKHIERLLPDLIDCVRQSKIPVTWSCDPMHGNTQTTEDGIKTRHFDTILWELKKAVEIHQDMDSILGGVHFELTGENVTECLGGAQGLSSKDLKKAYQSLVDPRLNYEQSMEMALQLSHQFKVTYDKKDSVRAPHQPWPQHALEEHLA